MVHLEICMRKTMKDNYRVASGTFSESWAPSLQTEGGCRLVAEMAPAWGERCHWSPDRDVHQLNNSQSTGKQQASWKTIFRVPQNFWHSTVYPRGTNPWIYVQGPLSSLALLSISGYVDTSKNVEQKHAIVRVDLWIWCQGPDVNTICMLEVLG